MTAMMELNETLQLTATQEIADVRDIATSAGAQLSDLVDCYVNAPPGRSAAVREALLSALPADVQQHPPAFTVVEMPGEYQFIPNSIMCVAALGNETSPAQRQTWKYDGVYGVSAKGMLFVEGASASQGCSKNPVLETQDVLTRIHYLGNMAGDTFDLVDCNVYVADIKDAAAVRQAITDFHITKVQPAITLVQADGLPDARSVLLRCTGTISASPLVRTRPVSINGATITDRFVFASAQLGRNSSGSDAFVGLQNVLKAADVGLKEVVSCSFFVKNQSQMFDLFAGFYETFNKENPPPPTRGEYQAETECDDCLVAAKCVAARLPPVAASSSLGVDGSVHLVI
ncbi:unnamed protein product [Symbiodinium natans]|uniref:Uncharacterized protein n=1 Tax=Symbiodinium natans TaxID=878477 RepID=A0A812T440_9DINO|nr:unnamed protein product [Symbiodinium natans]